MRVDSGGLEKQGNGLRLAELIAALSLATDLGLGQPMTHALRTCLLAMRLGRALGLRESQLADTYYTTLLRFVGCTANSYDLREFTGGDDIGFRQLMVTVAGGTREEIAPEPTYEMPNNLFFEVTGVMQAVPGTLTGWYLYRLLRVRLTASVTSRSTAEPGSQVVRA